MSTNSETDKDSGIVIRPLSEMLVDLHVYRIPNDHWLVERRLVKNHAVDYSISAGFIRVLPELTLQDVRKEISHQLGYDVLPSEFIFLRGIGKNFAKVTEPEIYLLKNPDNLLVSSSQSEIEIKDPIEKLNNAGRRKIKRFYQQRRASSAKSIGRSAYIVQEVALSSPHSGGSRFPSLKGSPPHRTSSLKGSPPHRLNLISHMGPGAGGTGSGGGGLPAFKESGGGGEEERGVSGGEEERGVSGCEAETDNVTVSSWDSGINDSPKNILYPYTRTRSEDGQGLPEMREIKSNHSHNAPRYNNATLKLDARQQTTLNERSRSKISLVSSDGEESQNAVNEDRSRRMEARETPIEAKSARLDGDADGALPKPVSFHIPLDDVTGAKNKGSHRAGNEREKRANEEEAERQRKCGKEKKDEEDDDGEDEDEEMDEDADDKRAEMKEAPKSRPTSSADRDRHLRTISARVMEEEKEEEKAFNEADKLSRDEGAPASSINEGGKTTTTAAKNARNEDDEKTRELKSTERTLSLKKKSGKRDESEDENPRDFKSNAEFVSPELTYGNRSKNEDENPRDLKSSADFLIPEKTSIGENRSDENPQEIKSFAESVSPELTSRNGNKSEDGNPRKLKSSAEFESPELTSGNRNKNKDVNPRDLKSSADDSIPENTSINNKNPRDISSSRDILSPDNTSRNRDKNGEKNTRENKSSADSLSPGLTSQNLDKNSPDFSSSDLTFPDKDAFVVRDEPEVLPEVRALRAADSAIIDIPAESASENDDLIGVNEETKGETDKDETTSRLSPADKKTTARENESGNGKSESTSIIAKDDERAAKSIIIKSGSKNEGKTVKSKMEKQKSESYNNDAARKMRKQNSESTSPRKMEQKSESTTPKIITKHQLENNSRKLLKHQNSEQHSQNAVYKMKKQKSESSTANKNGESDVNMSDNKDGEQLLESASLNDPECTRTENKTNILVNNKNESSRSKKPENSVTFESSSNETKSLGKNGKEMSKNNEQESSSKTENSGKKESENPNKSKTENFIKSKTQNSKNNETENSKSNKTENLGKSKEIESSKINEIESSNQNKIESSKNKETEISKNIKTESSNQNKTKNSIKNKSQSSKNKETESSKNNVNKSSSKNKLENSNKSKSESSKSDLPQKPLTKTSKSALGVSQNLETAPEPNPESTSELNPESTSELVKSEEKRESVRKSSRIPKYTRLSRSESCPRSSADIKSSEQSPEKSQEPVKKPRHRSVVAERRARPSTPSHRKSTSEAEASSVSDRSGRQRAAIPKSKSLTRVNSDTVSAHRGRGGGWVLTKSRSVSHLKRSTSGLSSVSGDEILYFDDFGLEEVERGLRSSGHRSLERLNKCFLRSSDRSDRPLVSIASSNNLRPLVIHSRHIRRRSLVVPIDDLPDWLWFTNNNFQQLGQYDDVTSRRELMAVLRVLRARRRKAKRIYQDYMCYLSYLRDDQGGYGRIGLAADMWKRKYGEELRETHTLRIQSHRLQQHFKVLRHQNALKIPPAAPSDPSNLASLKTTATKLISDIEQLSSGVEAAKVRVTAESKLKNQVAKEARMLRAEVVDRKIDASIVRAQLIHKHRP